MERIYVKSSKAVNELNGNRTLSLKQRQLLIMVDGYRPQSYIARLFKQLDAERELNNLEKLGFIVEKNTFHNMAQKQPDQQDVVDRLSTEHLANIKNFLISSLNKQIGAAGKVLAQEIANCHHNDALKLLIAQWRLTLRNVKHSKIQTDDLIGELNHYLANPEEAKFIGMRLLEPTDNTERTTIDFTLSS